ncbi:hypothetical protein C823_005399 [Eubacterium plexicaudatum ASF492]|nr:hypothetical protein C823_005399 [Eubacterium plexicaudatum ASF492]
MLKCLYMLSQRYKDKKIIVYGVSRTSINLFTDLVLNHKVNIHAFWDADDKFTGEYFVNRNIINTAQLRSINNAIIIIPEVCKKQEIQKCAGQGIEVFYKDEVLEVNEEMNNKRIYIYGIDKRGENIYDTLKENGIEPCGACVTKLGRVNRWYGKEILSIEKIKHESNCSVILATDNWITLENMLEKLVDLKIEKYIPFLEKIMQGGIFSK